MTARLLASLCALAATARAVPAQTSAVVDEATFMLTRKGAPIGRESFKIIRAPGPLGQAYSAVATSAQDEDRITVTLATDSTGAPVSYEFWLRRREKVIQHIRGLGRPDRFSVLAQTSSGEAAREYVVRPGTALLDEGAFYQYFFVPIAARESEISAIVPRTARQARLRLESLPDETLSIGGHAIPARHLSLSDVSGVQCEIWLDPGGRLLKVALPAQALIATRDDAPRERRDD